MTNEKPVLIDFKIIPLDQLQPCESNPRQTMDVDALRELEASIAAHGLLQSLIVKQAKPGEFHVVAGQRRLRAMKNLLEAGRIKGDFAIHCAVLDPAASAFEISLAENIVREQMHPMDQCLAFKALITKKETPAAVAARFGVSETVVKKRLKLSNLSAPVIEKFRSGEISLEEAQAFTVSDDHKRQEKVLAELQASKKRNWGRVTVSDIRKNLTKGRIPATDKRVKFVTLKAFEEAGGVVFRDLFTDGDSGAYIEDVKLLDKLVDQQLKAEADKLRAAGWGWVEIRPEIDEYQMEHKEGLKKLEPTKTQGPSKDAKEKVAALDKELEAIEKVAAARDDDFYTDDEEARREAIEAEQELLTQPVEVWDPTIVPTAGAIITLGSGGMEIQRGWVKKKDQKEAAAAQRKVNKETGGKADKEEEKSGPTVKAPPFSQALTYRLTDYKTASIAAVLAIKTDVALAVLATQMATAVILGKNFGGTLGRGDGSLKISVNQHEYSEDVTKDKASRGFETLERLRQQWKKTIPSGNDDVLAWCLKQKQDVLIEIISLCVALAFDSTRHHWDKSGAKEDDPGNVIGAALGVDMASWFVPTIENYFGSIGKPQLLKDLKEIGKGQLLDPEKTTKAAAAQFAANQAKDSGWLPLPVRIAGVKLVKKAAPADKPKNGQTKQAAAAKPAKRKKAA